MGYRVAVVGATGNVGREMLAILVELRFPVDEIHAVASRKSGLGEINAHRIARPGDVLVIQGVPNVSSLGGTSATVGKRQGEIGAVVDGGARDVDHSRAIGYPIWSSSVTPITGKWRVETVGVNQPVTIAGVAVQPGGCSGLRYQLFFDERTLDGDVTTDFDGVTVVVDRMSVPYLNGALIDFVDTIEKQGFTIDNPNATGSCACGDSFQ